MRTFRNRRSGFLAGAAGLAVVAAGLGLVGPAAADAATGQQPGDLVLSPSSGGPGATPGWTTTTACPAADSADGAAIAVFDLQSNFIEVVTGVIPSSAVTSPGFGSASPNGAFAGTMGQIASSAGLDGHTVEFVVVCEASISAEAFVPEQSTFVTFDADGDWTTSATAPAPAEKTTTTLTASPDPATVDRSVTLTAVESAADGSHPAGTVQFLDGNADLGSPVAVNANGVASRSVTWSSADPGGATIGAWFSPTNATGFDASTGLLSLPVNRAGKAKH